MGIFFGKSKKSRVTEQDRAILQLKQQRDKIKLYQKKIELNLVRDRDIIKKLLSEDKRDRAKLLLKRKRYQEQLLITTDNQLENLEKLTNDLEFTQIEQQVLDGLKIGNEALKKLHSVLDIDEIEKIMDEARDGIEKQQEIDTIISGALTSEDEQAVNEEYESMLAELLPSVPAAGAAQGEEPPLDLPAVPIDEIEDTAKEKVKSKKMKEAVLEEAS